MISEKLKPCPFCGEPPIVRPSHPDIEGDGWTNIGCANITTCGQASVTVYQDEGHYEAAARRWNNRWNEQPND